MQKKMHRTSIVHRVYPDSSSRGLDIWGLRTQIFGWLPRLVRILSTSTKPKLYDTEARFKYGEPWHL